VRIRRQRKLSSSFSTEATAPLGILAVATPLIRYQIALIDSTITPNFQAPVDEEMGEALSFACHLSPGPMIRETVEIDCTVKSQYPDKPVILGGWQAPRNSALNT
jgi:hypothetical protein